jgi:hypothetical protein
VPELECTSCGAVFRVTPARDKIFHFRYMPEMVCLYTQCPTCGHHFLQFYGEQDEVLTQHIDAGLEVVVYSVPTESMIEAYNSLYQLPTLNPRELTEADERAVRLFIGELENEKRIQEALDDWSAE